MGDTSYSQRRERLRRAGNDKGRMVENQKKQVATGPVIEEKGKKEEGKKKKGGKRKGGEPGLNCGTKRRTY